MTDSAILSRASVTDSLPEVHIRHVRATVVIPTFRRPAELARCLDAIRAQTHPAAQVLVTARPEDEVSRALVRERVAHWAAVRLIIVEDPGVVAAMNAALAVATGDVFALTDDDSEPAADWLERLMRVLQENPRVAGVGGRDVQEGVNHERRDVGRLQWFGRMIGNHHVGAGSARDVDVLKGVCCAFRTEALRPIGFDRRLRGYGAQVHWELSLCLALRRAGWRLVYDPAIQVKHHVAPRHGADQLHRGRFDAAPHEDAVYNETLVLNEHLTGVRRIAFRIWSMLVGTGAEPGVLQLPRVLLKDGRNGWRRFVATQRARRLA